MSGRETVLGAVRTALADVPGSESPDDVPVPRGRRADHAGPDVLGLFTERAAEYRATVVRVPKAGAAAAVGRALARTGARSVVLPPGLPRGPRPPGALVAAEGRPPADGESAGRGERRDHHRRHRHRRHRKRDPRPRPRPGPPGPDSAAGPARLRSPGEPDRPRRARGAEPAGPVPAADARLRPLGHQRGRQEESTALCSTATRHGSTDGSRAAPARWTPPPPSTRVYTPQRVACTGKSVGADRQVPCAAAIFSAAASDVTAQLCS